MDSVGFFVVPSDISCILLTHYWAEGFSYQCTGGLFCEANMMWFLLVNHRFYDRREKVRNKSSPSFGEKQKKLHTNCFVTDVTGYVPNFHSVPKQERHSFSTVFERMR